MIDIDEMKGEFFEGKTNWMCTYKKKKRKKKRGGFLFFFKNEEVEKLKGMAFP